MDWNNINRDRDTSGLGPIEYDQTKVPSLIRKHADNVRTKTYGQEVREAQARNAELAGLIASEAEKVANDADVLSKDTQNRFNDQISGITDISEVIDARRPFGAETAFSTVGERLDYSDNRLDQTIRFVSEFGAVGDGVTDDTIALNSAVEYVSGKNTVLKLEKGKTYMVSLDGWQMQSNSTIDFNGAKVKLLPNDLYRLADRNQPLSIEGVENVTIYDPIVEGDRLEHITVPAYKPENVDGYGGEWGHGISIYSSRNINLYNAKVSNCWGDGICLGGIGNENINLYGRTTITNCRRQGISFIAVYGFYGERIEVKDIYGTEPMAGLDFEPDKEGYQTANVVIDYLKTENVDEPVLFVQFGEGIEVEIKEIVALQSRRFIEFHANKLVDSPGYIKIGSIYADIIPNRSMFLLKNWERGRAPFIDIGSVTVQHWEGSNMTSDHLSSYVYAYVDDEVLPFVYFGGLHVGNVDVYSANMAYQFRDYYFRITTATNTWGQSALDRIVFEDMYVDISENTPMLGHSTKFALTGTVGESVVFTKSFTPTTTTYYYNADIDIPGGTLTRIVFNNTSRVSPFHKIENGDIQILEDGLYEIDAYLRYSSSQYEYRQLVVRVGSTTLLDTRMNAIKEGFTFINGSKKVYLKRGNVLSVHGRQTTGGALRAEAGSDVSGLQITRIGN